MKRKLLATYLLIMASMLIPLSLNEPEHIGTIQKTRAEILQPLNVDDLQQLETVQKVPINPQDYVRIEAQKYGWDSGSEWNALHTLITNESGWKHTAYNASSGACGLFQALPCSKLGAPLENVSNQAKWGLRYIKDRYGSPTQALGFWLSKSPHWY